MIRDTDLIRRSYAPERIWLWPEDPEDGVDKWVSFPDQPYPSGSTEYIRADLATPAPVVPAEGLDALVADAELAIKCMAKTGTFETGQSILRDCINVITALRSAPPVGARVTGWQPIETAPSGVSRNGKLGVCWMMLAIPHEDGGYNCVSGMRVGDKFFACLTFYCGGPFDGKQYVLREVEVLPTHWMPLLEPPAALLPAGEGE